MGAMPRSIEPDPERAADEYLSQAAERLRDAQSSGIGHESRFLLAYQSMVATMSGVLLANGLRVKGGAGGHVSLIRETAKLFEPEHQDLFARVDSSRMFRNQVAYDAEYIDEHDLDETLKEATELLALARKHIATR